MKKANVKRLVIYAVTFVVVMAVFAIIDGNTKKDLIGTWAYTYTAEYDDGLAVEITEYFELTDGKYRWYIDREETKTALLKAYDEYFTTKEITEEDAIQAGYESIADCKEKWLEEDLKYFVDDYNEADGGAGTWEINRGTFLFVEDGTSVEYKTEYRIEDDTLYLQTDGIVLTKVK